MPFSLWGDTLTLLVDRAPGAGEDVVVLYSALHTLDAPGSTLAQALADVVATGAAAYAALEWASYATNRVNVGGAETWRHYHGWAQERLAAFQEALSTHGRERRLRARRLYQPAECDPARARALRAEGWITLAGLEADADAAAEARRLGCGHALIDDRIVALEG